jgi:hypothetical protein
MFSKFGGHLLDARQAIYLRIPIKTAEALLG